MRLSKNRYLNFFLWRIRNFCEHVYGQYALKITAMRYAANVASPYHTLPGELIVSLTSYPARYKFLEPTLRSLMTQSVKPDRVILYVGDSDARKLPQSIISMEARGLEIKTGPDYKSFNKLVPIIANFPNAFIVTADDDVYYSPDWLEKLVSSYNKNNKRIIGHYGHYLQFCPDGKAVPSESWRSIDEEEPVGQKYFLPLGECGILYPPGSLHSDIVRDDIFNEICARSDDYWFFWMGLMAGSGYVTAEKKWRRINWPFSQKFGLSARSDLDVFNDTRIEALLKRYGWPALRPHSTE